jgi:beta-N-acetylhexosaminidase
MAARAFITGLSGLALNDAERAFLRDAQPWGVILFKRNVETPDQVRTLTDECRAALGRDAPVFVDQEGGRVQRLSAPHWPAYPAARMFGEIYDRDRKSGLRAAALGARLIASDLRKLGIDADCMPVADVPVPGADGVIGDRAYGENPDKVADLAQAAAEGLLSGGVLPVVKHIPGHGRATADSHLALPVVATDRVTLEASDFAAFRKLSSLPMAMTAHVVFSAIDPVAPATTSAIMVGDVIRGSIGFQGLLMSDDVSMKALSGTLAERSRAALAAGCDIVLHCNGEMPEMEAVASVAPALASEAARRAEAALSLRVPPPAFDPAQSRALFAQLIAPEGRLAS